MNNHLTTYFATGDYSKDESDDCDGEESDDDDDASVGSSNSLGQHAKISDDSIPMTPLNSSPFGCLRYGSVTNLVY